jgi:hypothetical protein
MAAPEDLLPRRLRQVQIAAAGLLLGAAVFVAFAAFIVWGRTGGQGAAPPAEGALPVVTLVAVFFALALALLAAFFPGVPMRALQRRLAASASPSAGDAHSLLTLRYTVLLMAISFLGGAAYIGAAAYVVEAQLLALAVVVGAVLLMLLRFPTEARMRAWLTRELRRLAARRLGHPPPAA